jgi:CTP synthase
VICLLDEQRNVTQLGGTMRLGTQPCHLIHDSIAQRAYQTDSVSERHRHRYEFNNVYRQQYEAHGIRFSGLSPDGGLVEIIELPSHPHFVAVQFHPEFKSKPTKSHPLFARFIEAAIERHNGRKQRNTPSAADGSSGGALESSAVTS